MKKRTQLVAAVAAALALSLSACGASEASDSFTVFQDSPTLVDRPAPDFIEGRTGAVLFFNGALRDEDGRQIGDLIGQVTTIDVAAGSREYEDRFRELAFNLEDGQIIVLGASEYVSADAPSPDFANDNAPVTGVVVGGTEKYLGARGVVITTKLADGTYEHDIQLKE
jgi:hypothetical protein